MNMMIVINPQKQYAMDCACQVYKRLRNLGVNLFMQQEIKCFFSRPDISYDSFFLQLERCDMVLVIGGDGTIIHTAKHAVRPQKPLLGINAGRLGFLAGLEQQQLHLLDRLLHGLYVIEKRMLLKITHHMQRQQQVYYALNDVVISKGEISRMIDLKVFCDKKWVSDYRADGLIFSTPTGSTAYALSAGGPIIQPDIYSIALTPICPHSLFDRTIVFSANSLLSVEPKQEFSNEIFMTVDGESAVSIGYQDRIHIEQSHQFVQLINLSDQPFYEVLHQKFRMRSVY